MEIDFKGLGDIPNEAQQYILHLQSRLASARKVVARPFWYPATINVVDLSIMTIY